MAHGGYFVFRRARKKYIEAKVKWLSVDVASIQSISLPILAEVYSRGKLT